MEQSAPMQDKLREFFKTRFAEAVVKEDTFRDQLSFYVRPDALLDVCQALRHDAELDVRFLSDITAVDWLGHRRESEGRFEVIYNLYSLGHRYRFFVKVLLPAENPTVASLCDLWPSANWLEREVFDLMGVRFAGHPDLTKILTPDELEGHPLRRDYPLTWEQPAFSWNKDEPPEVIK
ncbi:MAG: NADH-quinone oxidoreductase subunit C [Candidatus Zixiibacteriota bacterium]|nr:MAG: NADH-quinone oxidoreductase subunit C [candidate division Zixibacteria bacterium]